MLYTDIKPYIDSGSYEVNIGWGSLERWLKNIGTEVQLEPDFQRAHVWTEDQQRAYVEHIFRRGVTGKDIWWNCPTWTGCKAEQEPIVLVDGLQRITAVRKFMANELKVFLEFGGSRRDDFYYITGSAKRIMGFMPFECRFKMHVNELKTKNEVLDWYLQINAAGTPHTREELERVARLREE